MQAKNRRARALRAPSGSLCDDPPVNLFDAFAVVLVVVAVLLGYRSGALPQVGGLIGALIGGAVALLAISLLEEPLSTVDAGIRPYLVLVGLFGTVIIGESIGSSIGAWAGQGVRRSVFSGVDRLGGSVVAGAQALLVLWLAGGVFANGPLPRLAEAAQTSTVFPRPPTSRSASVGCSTTPAWPNRSSDSSHFRRRPSNGRTIPRHGRSPRRPRRAPCASRRGRVAASSPPGPGSSWRPDTSSPMRT